MNPSLQGSLLGQLITLREPLRRILERKLAATEVEDCLQETAVRLLEGRSSSEVVQPRAYLVTAARRLAIDNHRKHRREVSLESIPELLELEHPGANPEQSLSDNEQRMHIYQALRRLSAPVQRAVTLRYFHHMSYKEIAETMGISPRTVEKHLAKGLSVCRSYLLQRR